MMDTSIMLSPVLKLAQTLVSCPSLTPHDADCQKIIAKRLLDAGFQCESLRFEEVDNLWARYGTKPPLIVFAGHTDVVPTGPLTDWTSPPFNPVIRGQALYGRGTTDMKGALAAMVVAAEDFIKHYPQFNGSIGFLITSDEEGPALYGTQKVMEVLQKRAEKIDYCIIGEPSSEMQTGDQIRVGRRGSLHGKLIVHGKQGHAAHPHLAKNAIHIALQPLHELAQIEWDTGNEHFPPTTFQLTNIHAGTGATNVIPGHLEILFNFRFGTAVTPKILQQRTEAVLQAHGLAFDIEWRISGEPFLTQQGKLIAATCEAIQEVTHLQTTLSTGGGTSDGRFIAPTGAEVVELGVPHGTAHQIDENVKIRELENLVIIYHKILGKLCLS